MKNSTINVCLACDNNYVKHAGVVIASILANTKTTATIHIYILNNKINEANKKYLLSLKHIRPFELTFIEIDNSLFNEYSEIHSHKYITLASYYRLKIASLLKNVDKVIYLDCDFILNSDIQELFESDLEDYPIAGVHDIKKKNILKNPTYINAGMIIFNLDKMRELNLETQFLEWTKDNKANIKCGDQEIINEVCKGNIKILDDYWNVQSSNFTNRSCYTNSPKGIHFVSKRKPWHFASFSIHKKYYFQYLQLTPWALKGFDKIIWNEINQLVSLIKYLVYRPLFILRPKFYQAVYYTYIKPIFQKERV